MRLPGLQSGCRLGGHHCQIHRPIAAETCKYSRKISGMYVLRSIQMTCCLCYKPRVNLHSCLAISWMCPANPCTPTLTSLIVSASEGLDLSKDFPHLSASVRREQLDCCFSMEDQTSFDIFHNSLHGRVGPVAPRIQQLGRSQFRGLQTLLWAIGSRGSEVRN